MALIGSITNWGEIQGQVNNYDGQVTGVISSAELLGGQVVGMRGLKGDKGDTGDTGEAGADGQDGFSPSASVSKVGGTATITITDKDGTTTASVNDGQDGADGSDGQDGADGFSPSASVSKVGSTATITITDKDGTTTAEVHDGSGGGASAFIAEYGVTTYADVKDAYDEDAIIICTVDDFGNTAIFQLAYYDDANKIFYFAQPESDGLYWTSIATDNTWDEGYFPLASTETATQLRNGLMDALDKQKLDTIASGAEVNVQSDWNEADNTKDDFIKNKPTIPSKVSDLNNDSGFIPATTNEFVTATPQKKNLAYTGEYLRVQGNQDTAETSGRLNLSQTRANCFVQNKFDTAFSPLATDIMSIDSSGVVTFLKACRIRVDYQGNFYNGFTVNDAVVVDVTYDSGTSVSRATHDLVPTASPQLTVSGSCTLAVAQNKTLSLTARNRTASRGTLGLNPYTRMTIEVLAVYE